MCNDLLGYSMEMMEAGKLDDLWPTFCIAFFKPQNIIFGAQYGQYTNYEHTTAKRSTSIVPLADRYDLPEGLKPLQWLELISLELSMLLKAAGYNYEVKASEHLAAPVEQMQQLHWIHFTPKA